MGATVFAAKAPWGASSAGEAALCLLPAAPWALRHTQPRMSSHRPTFDQPSRITRWHPGKAGKGPLPKLPGRVLYRSAADRRNTTRATIRESSRHSYRASRISTTTQLRKTDALVAGSAHPGWRRHWCWSCAQVQSRFCAGVQIGAWTCASRPQLPGTERTPGPTRAHSGPQTAPCANVNTPPATQSAHAFRTASPANVNGIAGPGAFYLPRALFVAADGAGALAV